MSFYMYHITSQVNSILEFKFKKGMPVFLPVSSANYFYYITERLLSLKLISTGTSIVTNTESEQENEPKMKVKKLVCKHLN